MTRALELPLIVPWIRLDRDAKAEEESALRRAKERWLAGFCLFGGEAEQVRRLIDRLRDAAGRPIFVASDMERGAGQQVRGLRVLPDAAVWGLAATPQEVESFGAITACDARSVGVDVLFAPVLDVRSEPRNPIVGSRAFAWDPDRVALLGAAFVAGAISSGCAPTAKHWPGHGATTADSHDAIPSVAADAALLRSRDVLPFAAALAIGCPAVMTAHVAFPALDATGAIATFSKPMIDELRALPLGADADLVVFTDALLMAGAGVAGGEVEAARRALLAGCDAMLIPTDPERLAAELLDVTSSASQALLATLDRSARRLRAFAAELGEMAVPPHDAVAPLEAIPPRVADRALKLAGGHRIDPLGVDDVLVIVDDDGVAGRGDVLVQRAERSGVEVLLVRMRDGKPQPDVPQEVKPAAVVLMASVRAWKGTASASEPAQRLVEGLADRADEQCQIVSLAPRPLGDDVHLPGTGPDVEAALADRFFGD